MSHSEDSKQVPLPHTLLSSNTLYHGLGTLNKSFNLQSYRFWLGHFYFAIMRAHRNSFSDMDKAIQDHDITNPLNNFSRGPQTKKET